MASRWLLVPVMLQLRGQLETYDRSRRTEGYLSAAVPRRRLAGLDSTCQLWPSHGKPEIERNLNRKHREAVAQVADEGMPTSKDAGDKRLLGLARAVNDLIDRACSRRLQPDETHGGTFTITNHGVSGSLPATPIINQPQAAILGVGAIEKRPVVVEAGTPP
jgi:hypothetical protein